MSVEEQRGRPADAADDESPRAGESFLGRFSRRKAEARSRELAAREADPDSGVQTETAESHPPTDADMPPVDSLTIESDFTGFLSERVSESLRRAALRKLFHSAEFNIVDGLDEYADDFTTFEALGDIVTADMRHMLEVEARKAAERLERETAAGDSPPRSDPEAPDPEQAARQDAPPDGDLGEAHSDLAAQPPAVGPTEGSEIDKPTDNPAPHH